MNSFDSCAMREEASADPAVVASVAAATAGRPETPELDEKRALLRLLRLGGIGPGRLRLLRAHFGSAAAALDADIGDFAAAIGASQQEAASLFEEARRAGPKVDEEFVELARLRARLVARGTQAIPRSCCPRRTRPNSCSCRARSMPGPNLRWRSSGLAARHPTEGFTPVGSVRNLRSVASRSFPAAPVASTRRRTEAHFVRAAARSPSSPAGLRIPIRASMRRSSGRSSKGEARS